MATNEHAPESLRLVHGMEHAGLSPRALEIERSREFKLAFVHTISEELGFAEAEPEILAGRAPSEALSSYLETFGPDGHPPELEMPSLVTAELASRAGGEFAARDLVNDICVFIPPDDWRVIGGFEVTRDGQPWTVESAVAEYESRHGKIEDPAVRAELAAIRVYVQIEWEIAL
mgnify:CR=1 FL=1